MAQQLNYYNNPLPAYEGMVAPQEGEVIWSKVAGSGGAGIGMLGSYGTTSFAPPAQLISTGTSGDSGTIIKMPSGTYAGDNPLVSTDFIGIPIYDAAQMASDQITTATSGTRTYGLYKQYMAVPVLRKGRIWVFCGDAIATQGAPVYVYATDETNRPAGTFGSGAGTGKVVWSNGTWLMTLGAAGLALMEVW